MFRSFLAFAGFSPAPRPPRPPSARRIAPVSAPSAAPPVRDKAADAARKAALKARAEAAERDPHARFCTDVATVVRTYDRQSSQPSAEQLYLAKSRLGEVGEYVRAVYVGGGRLAVLPTSHMSDRARTKAYREHILNLARTDLDGWDVGATAVDKSAAAAKRFGDEAQPPIVLPEEIRAKIDARAVERIKRLAEQAARRGGGTGGGSTGPTGSAAPAAPPATPLPPEGKKDDEEKPEGDEPPAGPKR